MWYNEGMRAMILMATLLALTPAIAHAQNEDLDIVDQPICFAVVNTADHTMNGDFSTDYYTNEDGIKAKHRSNFRLQAAGSKDEAGKASDRAEFCSYGPFLPDRMLTLRLRTLFPVFECKTRVDTGKEIVLKSERRPDDSGVQMWAECFDKDGNPTPRPAE